MKPDTRFAKCDAAFWAHVRSVSQEAGYTAAGTGRVKTYSPREIASALIALKLGTAHIIKDDSPTSLGQALADYFAYRADVLNNYVKPRLMRVDEAKAVFEAHKGECRPRCPLPMNKQKGIKRAPAYLTCIANMLIEKGTVGVPVDFDPLRLTTITRDGVPLRTLSRRVDGCLPTSVNPIAVWEIKEYYYTTTFGSRIADGVFETLLDGMELQEAHDVGVDHIFHLLIVDAYETWWEMGRPYLCRMVDMLNMGYVDEVLFGKEVLERLPGLVDDWVKRYRERSKV